MSLPRINIFCYQGDNVGDMFYRALIKTQNALCAHATFGMVAA